MAWIAAAVAITVGWLAILYGSFPVEPADYLLQVELIEVDGLPGVYLNESVEPAKCGTVFDPQLDIPGCSRPVSAHRLFVAALWIVTAGAVLVAARSGRRAAGNRSEPKPVVTMALIFLVGAFTSFVAVHRHHDGEGLDELDGLQRWAFFGGAGITLLMLGVVMVATARANGNPPRAAR